MGKMGLTQKDIVFEYFVNHPNIDVYTADCVDWVTAEYKARTGKICRDPDRPIRLLCQEGKLIKIDNGVYKYDPSKVTYRPPMYFSAATKRAIRLKCNNVCVVCGRGKADGERLYVDHVVPMDKGGSNSVENGQLLCGRHNNMKKNHDEYEMGSKLFEKYREDATVRGDKEIIDFCDDILAVYRKHHLI